MPRMWLPSLPKRSYAHEESATGGAHEQISEQNQANCESGSSGSQRRSESPVIVEAEHNQHTADVQAHEESDSDPESTTECDSDCDKSFNDEFEKDFSNKGNESWAKVSLILTAEDEKRLMPQSMYLVA